MDIQDYFKSLGNEVAALKQRARQIIAGRHCQTDGAWKESVVRQILRRQLPGTAVVGRGFVERSDWTGFLGAVERITPVRAPFRLPKGIGPLGSRWSMRPSP